MNFIINSRAIAAQLLATSHSSRSRLISLCPLQLYSTTSTAKTTGWKKFYTKKPKTQEPIEKSHSTFYQLSSTREIQKKPSPVSVDWARPSKIPWEAKVANSVNLIGQVQMPVQFQSCPDGKYRAATIIAHQDSISLRIPLIFEDDLAHIAACHLKENDCVYIDGQLSMDPPPISILGQPNFQVMVHNINFVEGSSLPKKNFINHEDKVHLEHMKADNCNQKKAGKGDDYGSKVFVEVSTFQKRESVKDDAYQKKERLEDNSSVDQKVKKKSLKRAGTTKDGEVILNSWRDLLKNPKQWHDHRENKQNGSVNPKYPDFKHKESGVGLWLNSAPKWVLGGLKVLEFDVPFQKMKRADDDSWKDLVENPGKWWDNRSNKISTKSPDFKHKESGKAIWLGDSPAWALSKLPPAKA